MDGSPAIFHPFYSISVISGHWEGENARLSAMKPCLRLERFLSPADLEPGTARSAGQRLTELTRLLTVFESALEGEFLLQWRWKRTGRIDHGWIAST